MSQFVWVSDICKAKRSLFHFKAYNTLFISAKQTFMFVCAGV